MQTVQIFSKLTIFDKRMNKNANKVQINGRKLIILFMHIKLGLPAFAFNYLLYTNICNFLNFSFNFDLVCGIWHDLIKACMCNAVVLNVNVSFKVTLNVSVKQQRLVIIL